LTRRLWGFASRPRPAPKACLRRCPPES